MCAASKEIVRVTKAMAEVQSSQTDRVKESFDFKVLKIDVNVNCESCTEYSGTVLPSDHRWRTK